MKVLHAPFCYYPDVPGGTEVYVQALCRELARSGIGSLVAAPADGAASYEHEGVPVRRFTLPPVRDLADLYGREDSALSAGVARLLDEEKPDVVHLHAFTRGVSLDFVRESKKRRIPTVYTYHAPTTSCQRGTLMIWGQRPCDGRVETGRCTACVLESRGLPRAAAAAVSCVPSAAGRVLGSARLTGGPWTALRMRSLVELRAASTRSLFSETDRIVAVCEWVRQVLLVNGVPSEKITLSRQGLAAEGKAEPRKGGDGPLKIAFLGRIHPDKGVHVLLEAARRCPEADFRLDVFGLLQAGQDDYSRGLAARAAGDERVRFRDSIPSASVPSALQEYDLLAVPSQFMETGPLVVLEAFGAGVPVLGSDFGGISELVRNGKDGMLVSPHASPDAWAASLRKLAADRRLVQSMAAQTRPPRTMKTAAAEMAELYGRMRGKA